MRSKNFVNDKQTRFRWVMIGLLFFITVINYMDRSSISYAVDIIAKEFDFTDTQIGLILGAFGIGYVIATFIGGILVDRYGAKRTLFSSVIFWSVALILTALSSGFGMLFIARALLGLAEGPNFPGLTRVVSDWLSVRERTRALSYGLMAVPIGLAIGAPVVSQLIIHLTWRGMFFVLAALALMWLPFWVILFRDVPNESKHVNKAELLHIHEGIEKPTLNANEILLKRKSVVGLWSFLFTDKTLLTNYWSFFVFGYFLFFFMGWLPSYLSQVYHLQLHAIGLFSILPWVLGAILMWLGGYISDKVYLKTNNFRASRTHLIWISQLLAGLCVLPVVFTHELYVAIVFISLAVGFILSANGAYYAVNIDIAKERSATAMGIMDACFALAGFAAPVVTGCLVTVTGHFSAAFVLLTLLALSSVILVLCFHRPKVNLNFS